MINNRIRISNQIDSHFTNNNAIIDKANYQNDANSVYNFLKEQNPDYKSQTIYLIRHTENNDNDEKIKILKLKEGTNKVSLIYKSPEKVFYPVFQKNSKNINYIFKSHKIINDLENVINK